MNQFGKFIKNNLIAPADPSDLLLRLREEILKSLLLVCSTVGLGAVLISVITCYLNGQVLPAWIHILFYLVILFITLDQQFSYTFKTWVFVSILCLSGSLTFLENGVNGESQIIFLFMVTAAILLLNIRAGLLTILISGLLVMATVWVKIPNIPFPLFNTADPNTQWMVSAPGLFINLLIVAVSFSIAYRRIEKNIGIQIHKARELEQERVGLTWQVSQKTHILQDEIVERKKFEDAFQESEAKYWSLLTQLPVGIYRATPEGKIIHANPALASILGFEQAEDLMAHWTLENMYAAPETWHTVKQKLHQEKNIFISETRLSRRDGVPVWIKITGRPITNPLKQIRYIDGMIEDITEQKKAHEALKLSEQRLALHVQKSMLAFVEWNLNFEVLAWNPAAEDIFGYKFEEVMGKRAVDLVFSGDTGHLFEVNWRRMISSQTVKHDFYENHHKDGHKLFCEWFITPLVNAEGIMIGVVSQIMDISERVQVEKLEKALYQIVETTNNTPNLLELFHSVHLIISDLIPAKNFFIALYDPITEFVEYPYYVDENDSPPERRKLGKTLTDYVIRTGKPLLAYPQEREKLKQYGVIEPIGTASMDWIGVPLITAANKVIGVLAVQTYTLGQRYTNTDKDVLVFVSTQVAMAIERKQSDERLKYLSTHDVLTGLYNRNLFETELERLQNSRLYPISILVADVDNLKLVNDQFGHMSGDNLLKQTAHLLKNAFRNEDIISRIGGDEFAILLPETDEKTAADILGRLRNMLAENKQGDCPAPLFLSVGMSTGNNDRSLLEILKEADDQMYQEKMLKKATMTHRPTDLN